MSTKKDKIISILAKRLSNGDKDAFSKIYDLFADDIFIFGKSIVRSHEDAKEILQVVFIKLWQHADQIDPALNLKSYLLSITKNECLNYIKSTKRRQVFRERLQADKNNHNLIIGEGYNRLRENELNTLKKRWFNLLPQKRKKIFLMSRVENKTYSQISDELGISINTVKSHMYKALKLMRDCVEREL